MPYQRFRQVTNRDKNNNSTTTTMIASVVEVFETIQKATIGCSCCCRCWIDDDDCHHFFHRCPFYLPIVSRPTAVKKDPTKTTTFVEW